MFGQAGAAKQPQHQLRSSQRRRKARKKKRKVPSEKLLPAIVVSWRRRVRESEIKNDLEATKKEGQDRANQSQTIVTKKLQGDNLAGEATRSLDSKTLHDCDQQGGKPGSAQSMGENSCYATAAGNMNDGSGSEVEVFRVMIVDDSRAFTLRLRRLLSIAVESNIGAKLELVTLLDPNASIVRLRRQHFSLVLIDHFFCDYTMTGLVLCNIIQEVEAETGMASPRIVISGQTNSVRRSDKETRPFAAFMRKRDITLSSVESLLKMHARAISHSEAAFVGRATLPKLVVNRADSHSQIWRNNGGGKVARRLTAPLILKREALHEAETSDVSASNVTKTDENLELCETAELREWRPLQSVMNKRFSRSSETEKGARDLDATRLSGYDRMQKEDLTLIEETVWRESTACRVLQTREVVNSQQAVRHSGNLRRAEAHAKSRRNFIDAFKQAAAKLLSAGKINYLQLAGESEVESESNSEFESSMEEEGEEDDADRVDEAWKSQSVEGPSTNKKNGRASSDGVQESLAESLASVQRREKLLEKYVARWGGDTASKFPEALSAVIKNEDCETLKKLLFFVAPVDPKRDSIRTQKRKNNWEWRGAVNAAGKTSGLTAMHVAAGLGKTDMVRILLDSGGDINASPLGYSVYAHALNSVSKGLGATQQTLDFLVRHGAKLGPTSTRVAVHQAGILRQQLAIAQVAHQSKSSKSAKSGGHNTNTNTRIARSSNVAA